MSQKYDAADWAENHQYLSAGIAHLFEALAETFEALVAIEYDAPWEYRP